MIEIIVQLRDQIRLGHRALIELYELLVEKTDNQRCIVRRQQTQGRVGLLKTFEILVIQDYPGWPRGKVGLSIDRRLYNIELVAHFTATPHPIDKPILSR